MNDKNLYIMCGFGDMQIGMVISAEARFDEECLRRAICLSMDAVPRAGCGFVPGWWDARWEKTECPDRVSKCPDRVSSVLRLEISDNADKDANRFLSRPFDLFAGHQMEALLIRDEQKDTLCLKISHILTDAGGLKAYAYLLSDIYRELALDPDFRPSRKLSDFHTQMPRFPFPRSVGGYLRVVRRTLRDMRNNMIPLRSWTFPAREAAPGGRQYVIRHFEGRRFAAISAFAKKHSASINDVMQAAFLRGLYRLIRPDDHMPLRLITTADFRKWHMPEESKALISNLSGFVYPNIGRKIGKDLPETCRLVRNEMRRQKKDSIALGTYALFLPFAPLPLGFTKRLFSKTTAAAIRAKNLPPCMTNMGPISEKRLDFGDIGISRAFLVPPIMYPPVFSAGLSGFRDSLTFSSGFCASGLSPANIGRLFDFIGEEVGEGVGGG